ncbi:STAND family AAA ATPase [Novosphingobium lentum]|uniref:STAND family AAA ATPase n=1 Tax=Novosphingobium lentum TaxID=145287 RepID=UPI0034E1F8D3
MSDVHWSSRTRQGQMKIISSLEKDLVAMAERGVNPDCVIFSGDLVQSGDALTDFACADREVLTPILHKCNLEVANLLVSPGNHDISRLEARKQETLESGLKVQLSEQHGLEKFFRSYRENNDVAIIALWRMQNFYEWYDKKFPIDYKIGNFCRIRKLKIGTKTIGVVLLNSAWRATGEAGDVDDGNLIVGLENVERAVSYLGECDYKICVLHHPFENLLHFDRVSVEARIAKEFDLVCSGHTHRPRPERVEDIYGSSVRSSAGSLYAGSEWFNGYQIIEIDFVQDTTSIYCREYFQLTDRFAAAANLTSADPLILNFAVKIRNPADQIELMLQNNRGIISDKFIDHLNFAHNEIDDQKSFIDGYACPKLYTLDETKLDEAGNLTENFKKKSLDEIIKLPENVFFHGSRQSGKTGLKLHVAYRYALGIGCDLKIPVFIDANDFSYNLYGIRRAVQRDYDIPNKFEFESAVKNGQFVFLIEDIGQMDDDSLRMLNKFSENFKPCRTFAFGCPDENSLSKQRHFKKLLPEFVGVGLGQLTRSAIRKMTHTWFGDGVEGKSKFDLVVGQINRDGLPKTAYMVGLLLWAAKQGQQGDRLNEAILLQNVLDHLLGRSDFRSAKRGSLTTKGRELLLNTIANKLDQAGGSVRSGDLVVWVEEYFSKKKLRHDSVDVVGDLVNCGILKRDNGDISFRYKCFQEFYIALGMIDPVERDNKSSGLQFLRRGREIELLSGLQSENNSLIENILDVLEKRTPRDLAKVTYADFESAAFGTSKAFVTRDRMRSIRRTRLTDDQLDQVMDALDDRATSRGDRPLSESLEESGGDLVGAASLRQAEAVKMDVDSDSENLRPGTFMAGLTILARVLRNSDHTDFEVKGPAVDRLLDAWCRIHVMLTAELRWILERLEDKQKDKLTEQEFETLVTIIAKMLFGVIAEGIVSDLSTPALCESLHELDSSGSLVTGKKLISLMLLEDADDPTWPDKWKGVIDQGDSTPFEIDALVDRLWRCVNRKALDSDQDRRVIKVVDAIESRFGWSNEKKSSVIEEIRGMATIKKITEEKE